MVTYIDTKNREKYQVLFNKAEQVFRNADSESLPAGIDLENLSITTLNQYYAYLEDIIALSSNEDIKRYFTRLPLDEEVFEIDANTRNIKVPSSFARNGVGVQGDEMAEVIYFTIDRYFDAMDLYNTDIVIQWEARDKNRQVVAGISPNYGKDIETIPGKIIFGWPIYSELTETAGNIKFAVRFITKSDEVNENGNHILNYSLATLPAEISVGQSLNYDLIDNSVREINRGSVITSRIKSNNMTYDPSYPTPGEPVISTPLHVVGESADVRVVDLPIENNEFGSIQLGVSARPYDIGAIRYEWQEWPYDAASGEYSNSTVALNNGIDNGVYEEVTENLGEDIYYRISSDSAASVITYEPISISDYLDNTTYVAGNGFEKKDGGYVKLYKRYSVATIDRVGIYTVDVGAKAGINGSKNIMDKADGIKVPGPLKPVITLTDADKHVIVANGAATLTANAAIGEEGKSAAEVGENPQVSLTYSWKKVDSDGNVSDVIGVPAVMPVAVLPAAQLPDDPAWLENASENGALGAKGIFNQEHVSIFQSGTTVTIYTDAELKEFNSTDENQGVHQWIALDIDTELGALEGVTWQDSYTFTDEDENDLGVANGHILFWFKADEAPVTRKINDTILTFRVSTEAPQNVEYSFNADYSQMAIAGLPAENLDNRYYVAVTATRNNVATTENSDNYRLTNMPVKPVLKYRKFNQRTGRFEAVVADYETEDTAISINRKNNAGAYNQIKFSVDPISAPSDDLSYIWMRMNLNNESDWVTEGLPKLRVDIGTALNNLFEDYEGEDDIPVDGGFDELKKLHLGEPVSDEEDNGPELQLSDDTPLGYYYCIVINELNNYRVANVSPFFHVING